MEKTNKPLKLSKRANLKSSLERGDIKNIAEISQTNRVTVYNWFRGLTDHIVIQKTVEAYVEKKTLALEKRVEENLARQSNN